MTFDDALDFKAWLYMASVEDDGSGRLRVVVCLGGHHQLPRDLIGKHVNEIAQMPIEYTTAPYIELIWKRYFTLMVRDEGAAAFRAEEKFRGHGIRVFERSWLLTVVPELSNGLHDIPGVREGLKHYAVCSLNHIIDVLAYEAPEIVDLGELSMNSKNRLTMRWS